MKNYYSKRTGSLGALMDLYEQETNHYGLKVYSGLISYLPIIVDRCGR